MESLVWIVLMTLGALGVFAAVVWTLAPGWLRRSVRHMRKHPASARGATQATAVPGRVAVALSKRVLVPPRLTDVVPHALATSQRVDDESPQPMSHVTTHARSGADSQAADTAWPSTNWPPTQPSFAMASEPVQGADEEGAEEAVQEFAPTRPMQLEVLTPH